jgi:hypothetical protein
MVDLQHLAAGAVFEQHPHLGRGAVGKMHRHPRGPALTADDDRGQGPAPGSVSDNVQGSGDAGVIGAFEPEGLEHGRDRHRAHDDVVALPVPVLGGHPERSGELDEFI